MENKIDMVTVLKIIGIATSIGKAGIDFAEGEKQCRDVMADFEAQIRQDQKEKCVKIVQNSYLGICDATDITILIMEAK